MIHSPLECTEADKLSHTVDLYSDYVSACFCFDFEGREATLVWWYESGSPEVHPHCEKQGEEGRFGGNHKNSDADTNIRGHRLLRHIKTRLQPLKVNYFFSVTTQNPNGFHELPTCTAWDSLSLPALKALGALSPAHLTAWTVAASPALLELSDDGCQFRFILQTSLMDGPRSWLTGCPLAPQSHDLIIGKLAGSRLFHHARPIIRPPWPMPSFSGTALLVNVSYLCCLFVSVCIKCHSFFLTCKKKEEEKPLYIAHCFYPEGFH